MKKIKKGIEIFQQDASILGEFDVEPGTDAEPRETFTDELPINLGSSFADWLWNGVENEPTELRKRDGATDDDDPVETREVGSVELAGEKPRRFHSTTRKRCEWTIVRRQIVIRPQISTVALNVGRTEPGPRVSGIARIKALFRRTISTTLKLKIATGWQAVTGLPIPVQVGGEGEVSSQTIQSMEASLETVVDLFIQPWITIVTGKIWGRLVIDITDTYEWKGPDCESMGLRPNPESYKYTLYGAWVSKPIVPLIFTDYEFGTSSVPVRGRNWARGEAEKQFQDFLGGLGSSEFVRTLPLPDNMPAPIN